MAFLMLRDGERRLRLVPLPEEVQSVVVGRDPGCAVALAWDEQVSRAHAELLRVGGEWVITDEGLSRNGTFVNGNRAAGRQRLADGDVIRVGATLLVFRRPGLGGSVSDTTRVAVSDGPVAVTPAQRRVLVALCRPLASDPHAAPASNQEIADELVLSIAAIKTHIRGLFTALEVEDLPQNRKRARLAQVAFQRGLISERDLAAPKQH